MIVEVECVTCGSAFRYEQSGRGRRRRTCSPKCRRVRQRSQNASYPRLAATPRIPKIPKVCVICDQPFMAVVAKRKACGPACGGVLAKRNGDMGRRRNADERRRRVCEGCSAPFLMRNPSGQARAGKSREGRFCSHKCAIAERRAVCSEAT